MYNNHRPSSHILQARQLVKSAKEHPLSEQEREKKTIDLAALLLKEAVSVQTWKERRQQQELARMMEDPKGKAFTTNMTDECFRSKRSPRVANQIVYLLNRLGIPRYLSPIRRLQLQFFKWMGIPLSFVFVPLATFMLRKATSTVILPGERKALSRHMHLRRREGVRLNLNHLGEAILGEEEAKKRLSVYLHDLTQDDIEYVSIKISTIYSQIHLLDKEKTLTMLADKLRQLYRAAMKHTFTRNDGTKVAKFVNLDMEEYKDLLLTKELFVNVLNEKEFFSFSAGIVLQAYLPDSHHIQQELTKWAMKRVEKGGAPIKIRIVKGANLAMEQVEASLRGWEQAPYKTKHEVDANYKRMVAYGCIPEHAHAVYIGVASHNLFDISYALLLRSEQRVEKEVSFEMLEGMADHMRRAVQSVAHDILLYCPVATREDFQSAIAYLIRRLDENTGPENFLRHSFGLRPGTKEWQDQVSLFFHACAEKNHVGDKPHRKQNRFKPPHHLPMDAPFENETDTDFSLPDNHEWAMKVINEWKTRSFSSVPLVINGKEMHESHPSGKGVDPSHPHAGPLHTYSLATWRQVDEAIKCAKAHEPYWGGKSVHDRCTLISLVAEQMRKERGDLIGVMMRDGGKTFLEAEPEVSEAIDFAEYYLRSMHKMDACKDIRWKAKGIFLVTPPWNFPISIPAGCILAALVAGNCVIFKPAPEAVLSGWILVNLFWNAGIPKEILQFVNCVDDPIGSQLIADSRINGIVLTGGTATARLFMKLRPSLDLIAETGGKNAFIITSMADRDLAIKDLVHSAFGHSGQKCSAASLAILEAEVYDDKHFRKQLKDAVESLSIGTPWELSSKVVPLIREAEDPLLRGLTKLERGEEWLVKPKKDPHNPHLWSPGVKFGVKEGSFMHQTELFGPVLAVMRAKDLDHALRLANGTAYGLTSGIHSLDEREQKKWIDKIEAGNLYVNRGITGAIVRRQPFGGCKASAFGHGAKAGGPNYVAQFMHAEQVSLPQEKDPVPEILNTFTNFIEKIPLTPKELGLWYASISNYTYWAKRFAHDHDPSLLVGEDNFLRYRPHEKMAFRIQHSDSPLDVLRTLAAALITEIHLNVSWDPQKPPLKINDQWPHHMKYFSFTKESEEQFLNRMEKKVFNRVRLLSEPSEKMLEIAAKTACYLDRGPVLANGRFELHHFLREIAISIDYHRYGNLGLREKEERSKIL